jgi:secondary thiamine-phosphate synthase enzyme
MVHYEELPVKTQQRTQWIDITSGVRKIISQSNIHNGMITVSSLHTTAGITINENADPDVGRDFFWKLNQLIPKDPAYHHTEGNSDSHLKASLVGLSVQVPLCDGTCVLGTWQSIYFCEFDGPRHRRVSVSIIGE